MTSAQSMFASARWPAGLVCFLVFAAGGATAGAQSPAAREPHPPAATPAVDTTPEWERTTGFAERRKVGTGYYLTAAQIGALHDRSFGELIESRIPGLRMVIDPHSQYEYLASTRGQGPGALVAPGGVAPCFIQVFVDGTHLFDSEVSWVDPRNLNGVEYYDGTRVPASFRWPGAACGALLLWTTSGAP